MQTAALVSAGTTRYLEEIRRFPMLEAEEESVLAKRWREHGDADAAGLGIARRGVAQDFRAGLAGRVGQLLTGTVFDRIAPDRRIGVERRPHQVK